MKTCRLSRKSPGIVIALTLIITLVLITFIPAYISAATPTTVSTFECISIYWNPSGGSETNTCAVQYRKPGDSTWKDGLDLWFDARTPEYRGSIVGLAPDTTYEIKLTLKDGTSQTVTAKTWSENFPVGTVTYLPETSSSTLSITTSGTPSGYHLYTFNPGRSATIDVNNSGLVCIDINASYIIIRGLTLKNAKKHGIYLRGTAHHVVIEDCDISGWGEVSSDGWGEASDSAIRGNSSTIHNIIVQRNKMHHPRSDANNWEEPRPRYGGDKHPEGPQGITLSANNQGNNVIRYNEIYSDIDHCFNDCLGGGDNFSSGGFPGPDSDIYGNILSEYWDDGIECDGGGRNVRMWGNYFNKGFNAFSLAPVHVGPTYCFRNITNMTISASQGGNYSGRRMFKATAVDYGGKRWGGGRTYLFYNTSLQKMDGSRMLGVCCGLDGSAGTLTNVVSRNNIYYVSDYASPHYSINDNGTDTTSYNANNLDYDLCNDRIISPFPSPEPHGIKRSPIFDPKNGDMYNPYIGPLKFALSPGSPGYNAGVVIKNFSDGYAGSAPDMGAFEAGAAPMEFGVNAYKARTPAHGR